MIFNKIFKKKDKHFGKGWLGDEPSEKAYLADEIYASYDQVAWTEKPQEQWRRFEPIRNQTTSSSCVGYTVQLMLGGENKLEEDKFVPLSPRMIYARGFEPNGGMYYDKGLKLGTEQGSAPETLMPSENKSEDEMRKLDDERESDRIVAKVYRGGNYVYLPKDIDAVASFLQKGKIVAAGTRFNAGGFSNGEVILTENGIYGHAIALTDFTIYKGEKALIFQNSWGSSWGFNGLGIITETQFKSGGYILSAYYEDLKNEASKGDKPKLQITAAELKIKQYSGEVMKMQIMLQYLGFFPTGVNTTGYYGGITRQAVKDYQLHNNLTPSGSADGETIKSINGKF